MNHPIVDQLTPSAEQMPAVRAEEASVVVTAGAGAGKTRTLVARYLFLLAEGQLSPRQIAAITFTRKAAREMRNRVREAIGQYLAETASAKEQARWDRRYSQLDAARIGTIHQLCTEILRAHPAEAEVDPRFEVLDEAQSALLQTQAVEQGLAWAAETLEGVRLFELLGEQTLRQVAEMLLQRRLETREAFQGSREEFLARWAEALAAAQQRAMTALESSEAWHAHVATLRAAVPRDPDDRMAIQQTLALAALDAAAAAGNRVEKVQALADLAQINLRGGRLGAWPGGKEGLAAVKGALTGLRTLWREQEEILTLALTPLDEQLAAALPAVTELFARADGHYGRLKAERQVLDFDDLEARALRLLREKPDVRHRWQQELAAILVDEYQDTNRRQRDLVNLLHGDEQRLFIVGDAKQSIYRFRGAEVAVFREERRRIAGGGESDGGRSYTLAKSYRPHARLLSGLNALLQAVMGTEDNPEEPWVEPFAPLTHEREQPQKGIAAPYIRMQLAVGNKEEALPRAASALAATIAELAEDTASELSYGDVAILCRASTSFSYYENALDQWGIPYLTVAGRGFYDRPEIRDLLNALRALADPTDDLALMGTLRSPVSGYTDADLFALRRRQQAESTPTLWRYLTESVSSPFVNLLRRLHTRTGREPVADILKSFLDETDYRAALRQADRLRAVRNADKLLALAHDSGMVNVETFLEYIENVRAASSREGEARATAGNAVQIMSIHQAKGLEFPVVAIGDLNKQGPGRTRLLIDEEWGVLPGVKDDEGREPVAFQLGKTAVQAQEEAESRRLLYVAATRARDLLLLNGTMKITGSGRPSGLSGWLKEIAAPLELKARAPDLTEGGTRAVRHSFAIEDVALGCTFYESGFEPPRPPDRGQKRVTRRQSWEAPLLAPLTSPPAAAAKEEKRRIWRVIPEEKKVSYAPSWIIGSLVHEALAAWRFPEAAHAAAFGEWMRSRAREYGLTDGRQINQAARRTTDLLRRFRRHPLFAEIDGARRFHELPYTRPGEDGPETGHVDLLYFHQGRWRIVDFKTDRIRHEQHLEHVIAEEGEEGEEGYEEQVRRYAQAVAPFLGEIPECTLCLLDYQGGIHLRPVAAAPANPEG